MPTRGGARVARGLSAATVCALLTFLGHGGAGGLTPDLGLLLVLTLPLAGFLIALADRRRGPFAILALVAGSQLALHGLLQLLGTEHAGHAAPIPDPGAASPLAAGPLAAVVGPHPLLMLGAHTLATLGTAAVLAGAEDAVFTVAAALARVVPVLIVAPPVPEPARHPAPATAPAPRRPREMLGRRLHQRRGPPRHASCPL